MASKQITIDMHCHPAMKTWLFNSNFETDHISWSKEFFPTDMRVDFPKMEKGNVNVLISSIYLTEYLLFRKCKNAKLLSKLIFGIWDSLKEKVEKTDSSQIAFEQTKKIINNFEAKIRLAQKKGCEINIARNYNEMVESLNNNQKVIVHTIEGGHSLGRKTNGIEPEYLKNLEFLLKKGISMITLGHFFNNDLVGAAGGIPESMIKNLGCSDMNNPNIGLSKIGEKVVEEMLEKGVIIDLCHSNLKARKKIYEMNDATGSGKRPLVFSHTGISKMYKHDMNPDYHEIKKIQKCGGVIGLIFNNYWLCGKEEHDFLPIDFTPEPGLEYILKSIDYIHQFTGTYDNIAIGTDLDGFTDPPDDLYNISKMKTLRKALYKNYGRTATQKILGKNAMRILKLGWGNPEENTNKLK